MQELRVVPTLAEADPAELAHQIVEIAVDKKAVDIVMLDIRRLITFADYFVIMSASGPLQMRALSENIQERMKEDGIRADHVEGGADDGWILLDYSAVIVHVFRPEQRAYYALEELWSDATTVIRIQ
jgi:ribosome-associated protein